MTPPPPVEQLSVTRGDDDDDNASAPSGRASNRGLPDTSPVSARSRTGTRTLATAAAAAAGARGAVLAATDTPVTAAAARTSVSAQTPINPPMRLSATATAFSLGSLGGSISPGRSGTGEGTSIEDRARARAWLHRQYATSLDQQQQQQTGQAIGTHARGEFFAAMAAMRAAAAAGRQPDGDGSHARGGNGGALGSGGGGGGVAGGGTGAGSSLTHGGTATGLHRTPGAYTQALTRASYMTALAPEAPASATGGAGVTGGVVAGPAMPSELSSGSSGTGGGGGGSRAVGNQSSLAALPAFRHWESQRARLRIQVGRGPYCFSGGSPANSQASRMSGSTPHPESDFDRSCTCNPM